MLTLPGNNPLFPSLPDGTRDVLQNWDYIETWKAMEKLPTTGKVKAIGVANWSKNYLESLVKKAIIVPAAASG
jgi:glycerol 2-dehydrogenase (NADP+)